MKTLLGPSSTKVLTTPSRARFSLGLGSQGPSSLAAWVTVGSGEEGVSLGHACTSGVHEGGSPNARCRRTPTHP